MNVGDISVLRPLHSGKSIDVVLLSSVSCPNEEFFVFQDSFCTLTASCWQCQALEEDVTYVLEPYVIKKIKILI